MPADASADASHRPPRVIVVGVDEDRLGALEQLLTQLPADSGISLLVAHRLPADRLAALVDGLARTTKLRVAVAVDGEAPAADRVHLAPVDRRLMLADHRLAVRPVPADASPMPIDDALASLAASAGEQAVAVLLCAPDADGARGARAVREAGGVVLLLDTGRDAGGQVEAMVAGIADHVLPAADLPRALVRYLRSPAAPDSRAGESEAVRGMLAPAMALINAQTGIDFSGYRRNTISRRLERRMAINQIERPEAYLDLLRASPAEVTTLSREVLIGVTRFFRDEDAFELLRQQVIPTLVPRDRRDEPIRIWVAGCSTGEEAYSFAILLREALEALGRAVPVKIFATDLDRAAIDFASSGTYPASIVADVSPERLERFFVRRGNRWQVAKPIREMVIFAPHNLIKDPPFYRMDLISCRNLLIYLQVEPQRRVLSTFHFALNPDGYLLLGSSESLGELTEFFSVVDGKWKLYQKRMGKRLAPQLEQLPLERLGHPPLAARSLSPIPRPQDRFAQEQDGLAQAVIDELMPASLVVDGAFEILHVFGGVDRFLHLPVGKASLNILKMAPRDLAVAIGTAVRKVIKDGRTAVYEDVSLASPEAGDRDDARRVRLTVRPLRLHQTTATLVVVVLEDAPGSAEARGEAFDVEEHSAERIRELEHQMLQTGESLQAAIEELETSNEELQSTNEELLAANEELQSTNEELQSVNEELYTVNAEHQGKIAELSDLNDDLLNFLASTSIGTLFLDRRLCIRRFTPAVTQHINIIDKDIGRPLEHLSHNLLYDQLIADAGEVLRTLVPRQKEIRSKAGASLLMRVVPYRTEANVIKGVVLTFLDVSEIKAANESVRRLLLALEQCVELVMISRLDGTVEYVNQRFCDVTGYIRNEIVGMKAERLESDRMPPIEHQRLWDTVRSGATWAGRLVSQRKDGTVFNEEATIIPMRDQEGRIATLLKTSMLVEPATARAQPKV